MALLLEVLEEVGEVHGGTVSEGFVEQSEDRLAGVRLGLGGASSGAGSAAARGAARRAAQHHAGTRAQRSAGAARTARHRR
ncbi:hypothetical protein B1H20_16905 [Streptomyces violaceoruber]|uniref:Uncharacterized protein n=1 Tax=Streptomyces violaceoruber TaxID=1935 RepID=A0A1V0UCL6_STRVN|nr:hypothetical protein B1H20_16905 [Streptomyces violaceoruber]